MAATSNSLPSGSIRAHAVRLESGEDLVPLLIDVAKKAISASSSGAAFVLSAVGSLSKVALRLATASNGECGDILRLEEKLEILSMVGTFTPKGEKHIHMSVANGAGKTFGGHLIEGVVFTTVELVLGTIENVTFSREHDNKTGYTELVVKQTAAATAFEAGGEGC